MVSFILTALLLTLLSWGLCFSQDEDSFILSYNGGKIMSEPVTVSLLWFGTGWQESGQETIRNAITSLSASKYEANDSEVPTLGNWWDIVRQYGHGSNVPATGRVDVGAECFYTGDQKNMTLAQVMEIGQSVFNETLIRRFGAGLTCSQAFKADTNSIYLAVFSQTVKFLAGNEQTDLIDSCSGDFVPFDDVPPQGNIKMVWARAPQSPHDQCSRLFGGDFYRGPPNEDQNIDSLVGFILAKIAEEVTNPDGRGWMSKDGNGWSVSSYCVSMFEGQERFTGPSLFIDEERNTSFNAVGLNGYRYIVHYLWDQRIKNCALKLSETCESDAIVVQQAEGFIKVGTVVNHSIGLQPYPPNQNCQWEIHFPNSKFISFTINYLSVSPGSDDHLTICQSRSHSSSHCSSLGSDDKISLDKTIKITGSKAYVQFTSHNLVPFESTGWELSNSAGLCEGKKDVYDREGVIGYSSYVKGLSCQWVLHGKAGTPVTLSFTQISITRDLDFLAIYNGSMWQMANFSGVYSQSNLLPRLNFTGKVTIVFATQTSSGEGWSANFNIASPVNPRGEKFIIIVIAVSGFALLSCVLALIIIISLRRRRLVSDVNENPILVTAEVNGDENRIGEGTSSIVYKAILRDGTPMAIKSLKQLIYQSRLEEEILLKAAFHPNIITLVGIYEDQARGERRLTFEYMSRGSLSSNLRENGEMLDWATRLTIAVQISKAIQTLHMCMKPPICHGNINSENVLLDEHYNAKLGGFGNANYGVSRTGEDIWTFGALLFELLKGQGVAEDGNAYWFQKAKEFDDEVAGLEEWVDPRLSLPTEDSKMRGLAKLCGIAKWCTTTTAGEQNNDTTIPKIGDIVLGLKQVEQLFESC